MKDGVQAINAAVAFQDVSKSFGQVLAVNQLNLQVAQGEFLVLLGPSGCGKTTSLRMLAGLERISRGTIRIGDTVVNELPPRARNVAMVFQSYALYPHLSVFDNLAYPLRIRGAPKTSIAPRVREVAALLQIGDLLERRPKQLSGGQRQRGHVAIADQHPAGGGRLEAGDNAERRALAAARRPHQDHELAVGDLDVEPPGGDVPVGIDLLHTCEPHRGHGYPFTAPAVRP